MKEVEMKPKNTPSEPDKRYWWIILIAVPLATAIIAVLPSLIQRSQRENDSPHKGERLGDERERFYWSHIEALTKVLDKRLSEDGNHFTFSRYYQGCRFSTSDLRHLRSSGGIQLAGIRVVSPFVEFGFSLDDLRADSDRAFRTLDTLGRALSSEELNHRAFLIEVRSDHIRDEVGATIYTEIAADAIREYLVARYGVSRCRLIARGIGTAKPISDKPGESVTITNYGYIE